MAENNMQKPAEPRGFGEHTRGLAGEYAHEQGWGLDEAERTRQEAAPQDIDGGTDYEYGAADLGDTPVNTAIDHAQQIQNTPVRAASAEPAEATQKE